MSYDIKFWKLQRPLKERPVDIYRCLAAGQPVPGLALLPVDRIEARLKAAFPTFEPAVPFPNLKTVGGSIEVGHSEQHFRFDLRGECGPEAQQIVGIMSEFDCPLFDPQVDVRYDSADGIALGETPNFLKRPSGPKATAAALQAAALEKLRQQALARIGRNSKNSPR